MKWVKIPAKAFNTEAEHQALAHQGTLTKPPGSLGQLEHIATHLAGLQGVLKPELDKVMIRVFAADHGVVDEGVSAFPQVVTGEMVKNFAAKGAAITVIAESLAANFGVINLGTVNALPELPSVQDARIAGGTQNFCQQAAMTKAQLNAALSAGQTVAIDAIEHETQLFIGGEMGIGNTTSASALACALLTQPATALVGRGTGVDDDGIQRKQSVVTRGLALHGFTPVLSDGEPIDALKALQCLGGFEIAGLVGAYIACAQVGITVLVDGFISSVAALVAVTINPSIRPWLFFGHQSSEAGHALVLKSMNAEVLLSLNMRLGEASGAALAVPLMRMACQLHRKMATFESAGVSDGKREGESDHEGKIDSNGHSHSQIKSSCEGHDHGEG
ncbi:MAG: nicotinate-nucleotide--dimethylbenzimidazole phosphoribosyltransferase [Oleiphilaceae bacterium]|jgi:nicotinate-nucleotide--dimethylbenzimidazole phosphoribosyltransferase